MFVLEWPNNAIENTWLQILVRSTASTRLGGIGTQNQVAFYLGHAAGEVGGTGAIRTSGFDIGQTQLAVSTFAGVLLPQSGITNIYDFDKSRRVVGADLGFVVNRANALAALGNPIVIPSLAIPIAGSAREGGFAAAMASRIPRAATAFVAAPMVSPSPITNRQPTNVSLADARFLRNDRVFRYRRLSVRLP